MCGDLARLREATQRAGHSGLARALDDARTRLVSGVAEPLARQHTGLRAQPLVFDGSNSLQHLTNPDTDHDRAFCEARTTFTRETLDAEEKICGTCAHRAVRYLMAA